MDGSDFERFNENNLSHMKNRGFIRMRVRCMLVYRVLKINRGHQIKYCTRQNGFCLLRAKVKYVSERK